MSWQSSLVFTDTASLAWHTLNLHAVCSGTPQTNDLIDSTITRHLIFTLNVGHGEFGTILLEVAVFIALKTTILGQLL